jgi:hypothetical protein
MKLTRSRPILNLAATLLALAGNVSFGQAPSAPPPGADTLDFTGRLAPLAPSNIFRNDDYYVWCGSCIRGEDAKYYLFYARWPTGTTGRAPGDEAMFKDMAGWMKYSEIAAAVSDSPTGPFKYVATVLRGTGDPKRWDCFTAHNAHVQRFDGKIYLYYVSNNLVPDPNRWMQHADGQRVGVVVADSVGDMVAGKYRRGEAPIMSPDDEKTFCRAVNPGVTRGRDGRYLMMFKSRSAKTGGFMTQWISAADHPDGPFKLVGPALNDARYDAEDPYFWYDKERNRYYAIVKDFSRKERALSPQFGALALVTSEQGWGDWKPAAHNLVSLREYTDTAGIKHSLANLERPQLLFDDNNQPICLYAAGGEQDPFKGTPSFNLAIPLRKQGGGTKQEPASAGGGAVRP